MKLEKFAVNFGDNDFYNTWMPLLTSLSAKLHSRMNYLPKTKDALREYLVNLINMCSTGFYYACQNQLEYNHPKNNNWPLRYDYLLITTDRLLLNKEVDEYIIKNSSWFNSEFYYVEFPGEYDFALKSPRVLCL